MGGVARRLPGAQFAGLDRSASAALAWAPVYGRLHFATERTVLSADLEISTSQLSSAHSSLSLSRQYTSI
jgi:hypothetical protein